MSEPYGGTLAATGGTAPEDPFSGWFNRLVDNVSLVINGKDETVRLAAICLFAEGHLLLEDFPGMGKTMLARALAASLSMEWRRVQFTPDLLPSDVSGVSIYNQKTNEFEFHRGPVFANIVLGDEINRASPKTQSALLEVMAERRVTVDGVGYPVPRPFMVLATQNPIELEGTYRLPEAQLDRFLMKASLGAPDIATETEILRNHSQPGAAVVDMIEPVMDASVAQSLVDYASSVYASEAVFAYVATIASATRAHPALRLGVSPRASLGLVSASKVLAASRGRTYVIPEDVKELAVPVLAHRVLLTPEAELSGQHADHVVAEAVDSVPVPAHRADS